MTKVGNVSSRVIYFFHSVVLQLITDAVNVLLRNFSNLDYKKDKWKIGWLTSQRKKPDKATMFFKITSKVREITKIFQGHHYLWIANKISKNTNPQNILTFSMETSLLLTKLVEMVLQQKVWKLWEKMFQEMVNSFRHKVFESSIS